MSTGNSSSDITDAEWAHSAHPHTPIHRHHLQDNPDLTRALVALELTYPRRLLPWSWHSKLVHRCL